jgi:hypothetical protein
LDDSSKHPKVLYNIVRVIEKHQDHVYIRQLLNNLPVLIKRSPKWAAFLHGRIFNDPQAVSAYSERLLHIKSDVRTKIKKFLIELKGSKPEFSYQCDILLCSIKKKELKRFQLPLDAEKFKQQLEKACVDSFLATNASHLGEQLCGLGLYCDPSTLSIIPSINTQSYLYQYPKEEREAIQWCPELWGYAGENDQFFTELSQQLASELQHFSSDDEKEYFRLSIYGLCVTVLESMRERDFFKPDSIVAFAELGSQRGAYDIEWLERLNPQGIKSFIQWADKSHNQTESSTTVQPTDMVAI